MAYCLKGTVMEHKEYKKDELEVGMEVIVPVYIYYGWNSTFRYPIWAKRTITKITPKKTKITLDNGREIQSKYSTGLYKYDERMKEESDIAKAFRVMLKDAKIIYDTDLSKLGDDDLRYVAFSLHEATSVLEKKTVIAAKGETND